jgi:hypothetical protein
LAIQDESLEEKIKGWSYNINAEMKKNKTRILIELDGLDKLAEKRNLTLEENTRSKDLKAQVDKIWKMEEIKERQRAREKDIKKGDKTLHIFILKLVREGGRRSLTP